MSIQINVKFQPAAVTPSPVAPVPPQPVEVPAAARSGADVRLPRIDPSQFLAFLADDRDSRWPAGRAA